MTGNQTLFNQSMSKGHSAAWDLEWDKAAGYYRQALREFPDDSQALSYMANALFELQDYDEAMHYFQKVAEASPDDPLPLEKIAQIYEAQGKMPQGAELAYQTAELHLKAKDIDKAIENWTRSIKMNPGNLRARTRLAMTYERMGRKSQAVIHYLAIASLMQHSGNKGKALELVHHALKLEPTSAEAQQALGLLRANQLLPKPAHKPGRGTGEPDFREMPSVPELVTAAETEPTEDLISMAGRKALSALASLMFEAPDENVDDDGTRRSLQAIAMGTGPLNQARIERSQIVLHLSQAVDLQARNQFESAAKELENAINAGLDNPSAYFDLGMLRVKVGKLESGTRNLQQAVGHPDYSIAARLLLGQTFIKLGRSRESAIQYLHALKLADSMVVDKDQAEELKQLYEPIIESQSQEANEEVHKALSNSIENLLMRPDWRAQLIKARNQISDSSRDTPPTPIAELLTQTQSGQVVEMLANAHQMARNGYFRMAMEEAFRAVRYAPTYLPLHTFMGEILLQQDNVQEAITKFNVVARAYSARGEASRAIELLRKITRLAPLDLTTRQRLIEQLTAFGQVEETIKEYLDLGDVYYRLAELEKARDAYKKALNVAQQSGLNQWTIEILHHLADIDLQRLDWRRAMRIFKQINALDPDDQKAAESVIDLNFRLGQEIEALAALGNFVDYLNRKGNEQKALEVLEGLLNNDPDRVAIRRTLAEQYQRMGRDDDAIAQWDEVGDRLLNVGDKIGALHAIRSIVSLNPPNVSEYERLIDELEQNS